jgi:hypothetical protein
MYTNRLPILFRHDAELLHDGGAIPGAPCGDRTPALSPALPKEKRNLIARWIAGGATQ